MSGKLKSRIVGESVRDVLEALPFTFLHGYHVEMTMFKGVNSV